MKISILMLVKNGEKRVARALDSMFREHHPNLQVLVLDGGSTDGTIDIIRHYPVDLISGTFDDVNDAFNEAIKHLTGDVIGQIMHDDELTPGTLELVSLNFGDPQLQWIYFPTEIRDEATGQKMFIMGDGPTVTFEMMQSGNKIPGIGSWFRKHILDEVGGYDKQFGPATDYDLWMRFFQAGYTPRKVDHLGAIYYSHGGNLGTSPEAAKGSELVKTKYRL